MMKIVRRIGSLFFALAILLFLFPYEPNRIIHLHSAPQSVAITSDGQLGFVVLSGGKVMILDVPGRQTVNTIDVGGTPHFIITGLYPPLLGTTLGNRLQALSFRLVPECIVGIRAIDDLAEQHQGRITAKTILLEDGLERALLAMMPQFHVFHIVGNGMFSRSYLHHLIAGYKQELGVLIYKLFDEPGAGDSVYLDSLTGNPFHEKILLSLSLFLCVPAYPVLRIYTILKQLQGET
jgi:hypothetical protein